MHTFCFYGFVNSGVSALDLISSFGRRLRKGAEHSFCIYALWCFGAELFLFICLTEEWSPLSASMLLEF